MIVTFTTKHHADIVMFGDIATKFLKHMGHSGDVPSAARPEDLPAMVERLQSFTEADSRIGKIENDKSRKKSDEVPLSVRAKPLIELFEKAIEHGDHVLWK